MNKNLKSNISIFIAHCIERYDIGLFVFLAPQITQIFFSPSANNICMSSFVFGVAYLARPLGAIFIAPIGDIYGRKYVFQISAFLITIATLIIYITPEFNVFGHYASFLILLARFTQGLASGIELTSATLLVSENIKTTLVIGNLISLRISAILGLTLSGITTFYLLSISMWKEAFLIGSLLNIFNIFIRNSIKDSLDIKNRPQFTYIQSAMSILKINKKDAIFTICAGGIGSCVFYTTYMYLPTKIFINNMLEIKIIISLIWIIALIHLSFFVKQKNFNMYFSFSLIFLFVGSILMIFDNNITNLFSFVFFICGGVFFLALSPLLYQNLFSSNIRNTNISFFVGIGQAFLGGLAPFYLFVFSSVLKTPILCPIFFSPILLTIYYFYNKNVLNERK